MKAMNWQTKKIITLLRDETIASREAFTTDQMAVLENIIDRFEEALERESSCLNSASYVPQR
jgi:hypothetical protein